MTRIFLWYTTDVQLDSGHPTPHDGCSIIHFQTPCAQLGRVFLCFPFCYNSNISLIYCGCPTSCDGCGIFSLLDNSCPIRPSVPMFFLFIRFHLSFFQSYFHSYLVLRAVRIRALLVMRTCDGRPKRSQMGEDRRKWQWVESAGWGKVDGWW